MFCLILFLVQVTLEPHHVINIDKGATPYKILIANDSLLYYQDGENELGPVVGYNYERDTYFGNLKFGRGPLEIVPENRPIAIFADDLFYITDRAQNKVVVFDNKLNPVNEYLSEDELLSMSYLSSELEVSISLSPDRPIVYTSTSENQIAPEVTDSYIQGISRGYMMRQYRFRINNSLLFFLPIRTDYVLKYDPTSNELFRVRLNMLNDLPNPSKHINEAPAGPFGGMDVTFRQESEGECMYVLFRKNQISKARIFLHLITNDLMALVDEEEHSNTILKFSVNWESEKATLLETFQTTVPVNSIFFHGENLLALTYLNVEVPQLLFFQVK